MSETLILCKETRLLGLTGRESTPVLIPTDSIGLESLLEIQEGDHVKAVITRPRNIRHHRMFFSLMQVVFDNQTGFATLEGMLDAIKIALGHCEEIHGLDGKMYVKPKSVSFASMDQKSFKQFYDRAIDLILTRILPGADREGLEARVFEIMGLHGPAR